MINIDTDIDNDDGNILGDMFEDEDKGDIDIGDIDDTATDIVF